MINNDIHTARRWIDTRVEDMRPGQYVVFPTLYSTFSGKLVASERLGDSDRMRMTVRHDGGSEQTVATGARHWGYIRVATEELATEVQQVWEGEVVASVTAVDVEDAHSTYEGMASEEDGYLIRLVIDGRLVAEHQNIENEEENR